MLGYDSQEVFDQSKHKCLQSLKLIQSGHTTFFLKKHLLHYPATAPHYSGNRLLFANRFPEYVLSFTQVDKIGSQVFIPYAGTRLKVLAPGCAYSTFGHLMHYTPYHGCKIAYRTTFRSRVIIERITFHFIYPTLDIAICRELIRI